MDLSPFRPGTNLANARQKLNDILRVLRGLLTLRGDGIVTVARVPESGYRFGLDIPALTARLPMWMLQWGKATADWSSGNTVTLDPCDKDATDNGRENVTAYAFTPTDTAPGAGAVHLAIAEGDVLAYLSFGNAEGVLVNPPVAIRASMIAVKTWKDGGAQGTGTAQATWTYTVRTIDATGPAAGGVALGAGMSPTCRGQATQWEGKLDYPPATGAGWIGLGYYDAGGTFHLWDAGERIWTAECLT